MAEQTSIVRPDVSYAITDASDALYDADSAHPRIEERFERSLRFYDDETAELMRRHRRERQALRARHAMERRHLRERRALREER